MQKKKSPLSAIGLRRIFITSIIFMIILLIFGFSWLSQWLEDQHREADHAKIDAEIARSNVAQLQQLRTYIDDNQATINRAEAIVSEASQYQHQVIRDIDTFASQTGVTVQGYNFESAEGGGASTTAASGTTATNVTVTLKNPVSFTNYMRFLKAIEQNLTRMQVTGVSISPDGNDPHLVSNPQIGLEVYLKEER